MLSTNLLEISHHLKANDWLDVCGLNYLLWLWWSRDNTPKNLLMIEVLLHFNIHIDVHLFVGGFYSQSIPPKGCKLWSITAKKKKTQQKTNNFRKAPVQTPHSGGTLCVKPEHRKQRWNLWPLSCSSCENVKLASCYSLWDDAPGCFSLDGIISLCKTQDKSCEHKTIFKTSINTRSMDKYGIHSNFQWVIPFKAHMVTCGLFTGAALMGMAQ